MNQTAAAQSPGELSPATLNAARKVCFGLFLAAFALMCAGSALAIQPLQQSGAPAVLLVLMTTVTTLVALSRQLPAQNILLASAVIAVIGTASHLLGARTGIPFGPFSYTSEAGPQLFGAVGWFIPFLWIIAILNSRGVARLILRPWRKIHAYGYWLIGLTVALTLLLDLGLEPFATRVNHYWLWHPTKLALDWHGAPLSNFLGWGVTALLILAFATPALMKRKPSRSVPDYQPLLVWVLLNVLFIAGALTRHLWLAAGFGAAASLGATVFAIRGARW